jgi:hypothetical protein
MLSPATAHDSGPVFVLVLNTRFSKISFNIGLPSPRTQAAAVQEVFPSAVCISSSPPWIRAGELRCLITAEAVAVVRDTVRISERIVFS